MRQYLLLILFFLSSYVVNALPKAIDCSDNKGYLRIGKSYLEIAEDPTKLMEIREAINLSYKQADTDIPNFGFNNSSYWFRFTIINSSNLIQKKILEIKNPNLDYVSLITITEYGDTIVESTGDYFPFQKRPILNKYFRFPITLLPGGSNTFYLNVNNVVDQFHVPINLGSIEYFNKYDYDDQVVLGIYFGGMAFVLLLNFFFYWILKDRTILYYLGYVAALMLLQLSLTGLGILYLWSDSFFITNRANPFFASVSIFFLLLFSKKFLKIAEYIPRIDKLFSILSGLVLINVGFSIIPQQDFFVFSIISINTLALILNIIIIPVAYYIYRAKKYKPARFFIVAFFVLVIAVLLFILKNFGILPPDAWPDHGLLLGSGIEVLLFTLAVLDRFKQFKEDSLTQLAEVNKLKSEANIVLEKKVEERTAEIKKQKVEIEEKKNEIISSIRYAKRIQEAILPPKEILDDSLSDYFVLYAPRDIVSGDFYWASSVAGKDGKKTIVSVADCTGHGVPGAFMSLIGNNFLKKAAFDPNISTPGEILDDLNSNIIETLNQSYSEDKVRDGMDISLVVIDQGAAQVQFAGANNPIYVIRNGQLYINKSDKQAIGSTVDKVSKFTSHSIDIEKGDCIYLFTDGYADQFGGEKGKKMMYKKFQEILLKYSSLPMESQRQELSNYFNEWKGDYEQLDDVCIIGMRL